MGVLAPLLAAAPPFGARSTSAATIRPPGPLPVRPANEMPCACAIFLASGDALIRAPLPGAVVDGDLDAVTGAAPAGAAAGIAGSAAAVDAGGFAPATSGIEPSAGAFSFFPRMTAIGVPQATFWPVGTRSL